MSLTDHLEELRRRFIISLISFFVGSAFCLQFSSVILKWLSRPVGPLAYFAPSEAFFVKLKIGLFAGFLLSSPLIFYQAWAFVAKGLTEKERKVFLWMLPVACLLFACGVALALFGVLPAAVRFLMAYGSDDLRPMIGVAPYLDFVVFMTISFGIVFELPVVLYALCWFGVVSVETLTGYRRYIYLGAFVAAALLTPGPDIFSQFMLAVPMIILYELSLAAIRWKVLFRHPAETMT